MVIPFTLHFPVSFSNSEIDISFSLYSNDQEELFDMILCGDYVYLSPFWDDISESGKVCDH